MREHCERCGDGEGGPLPCPGIEQPAQVGQGEPLAQSLKRVMTAGEMLMQAERTAIAGVLRDAAQEWANVGMHGSSGRLTSLATRIEAGEFQPKGEE